MSPSPVTYGAPQLGAGLNTAIGWPESWLQLHEKNPGYVKVLHSQTITSDTASPVQAEEGFKLTEKPKESAGCSAAREASAGSHSLNLSKTGGRIPG
jgi:hypothetical protein